MNLNLLWLKRPTDDWIAYLEPYEIIVKGKSWTISANGKWVSNGAVVVEDMTKYYAEQSMTRHLNRLLAQLSGMGPIHGSTIL